MCLQNFFVNHHTFPEPSAWIFLLFEFKLYAEFIFSKHVDIDFCIVLDLFSLVLNGHYSFWSGIRLDSNPKMFLWKKPPLRSGDPRVKSIFLWMGRPPQDTTQTWAEVVSVYTEDRMEKNRTFCVTYRPTLLHGPWSWATGQILRI